MTTIPSSAVDAAARGLAEAVGADFDQLDAIDKHNARETAIAALNAAAPHLLAAKDAEIERMRGALVSIEYAAERADRKGYDLDVDEVLDQTRLALGSAESAPADSEAVSR